MYICAHKVVCMCICVGYPVSYSCDIFMPDLTSRSLEGVGLVITIDRQA